MSKRASVSFVIKVTVPFRLRDPSRKDVIARDFARQLRDELQDKALLYRDKRASNDYYGAGLDTCFTRGVKPRVRRARR